MRLSRYISGISIGADGSTNRGINHFSTGLATDGTLAAWAPSGGLYGWHISQLWLEAWEPSTGNGLGVIVMDSDVLNSTSHQRILMRFPAGMHEGGVYVVPFLLCKWLGS